MTYERAGYELVELYAVTRRTIRATLWPGQNVYDKVGGVPVTRRVVATVTESPHGGWIRHTCAGPKGGWRYFWHPTERDALDALDRWARRRLGIPTGQYWKAVAR